MTIIDSGRKNSNNLGRSLKYLVTANFRRDMGVDTLEIAKTQLDGILADIMQLSGNRLTAFWSLVENNGAYHAHMALSWLPTKTITRLFAKRVEIVRVEIVRVLHENLSKTNAPQKRIKPITFGVPDDVLSYIALQPNGGIVKTCGWLSENALCLQYENFCSWHYSKQQIMHIRICTECHLPKPPTIEHFYTVNDGTNNLRGECRKCHNLKSIINHHNRTALAHELLQGLAVGSLGRLTVGMVKELLRRASGKCEYYGHALTAETISIDHLVTFARGGDNSLSNLRLTTRNTNSAKGDKSVYQWLCVLARHGVYNPLMDNYPSIKVQQKLFA